MIGCGNPAVVGAKLDKDSVAESTSKPHQKTLCDLGLRLCLYNIYFFKAELDTDPHQKTLTFWLNGKSASQKKKVLSILDAESRQTAEARH